MRPLALVYVFLCLLPGSALATAPHFTTWFPFLRPTLSNISSTTCAPSLAAYHLNPERVTCQAHVNCILPNMLELDKADMAHAAILLGLLPVVVATFGPDIKEIALLSSRRPLLSLLLSIGVPAVYISRPMEYADPLEILEPGPGRFTIGRVESARLAAAISGAEYSFVALAIVNLLWVSCTLGMQTVLAWKCIAFMPIAWALVPMVVHVVAATAFRTSKVMRRSDTNLERAKGNVVGRWLRAEYLLCANQTEKILRVDAPGHITVALNYLATLMGSVHVMFGIVVFASLLFINLLDATLVFVRYMASILVCRLVLKYEIAGARSTFILERGEELSEVYERKNSGGLMSITYSHQKRPSVGEKLVSRTYTTLT